jgi:hypothetical protein
LSYWHRARGDALVPVWHGLEAAPELLAAADTLAFADVVGTEDEHRLLITIQGAGLLLSHGGYAVGKFLDEILRPPYKQQSLASCRQSIVTKLPVYTVVDLRDHKNRIVNFERLLLPFGKDAATVDGLMVSFEITSPEGPVDTRDLVHPPARAPAMALCATILH